MRREHGFTLVELMMALAILGILASMAITSLWRAKAASNETSAIASLRSITQAQVAYSNSCGYGFFATSLPALAQGMASGSAFLSPDLTAAPVVQKSGYRFQLAAAMGSVAGPADCNGNVTRTGYYARSEPMTFGTTGQRSFATLSPTNVIWQNYTATAPSEPFGAPSIPAQ